MSKRLFALILSGVMTLSLMTACGSSSGASTGTSASTSAAASSSTTSTTIATATASTSTLPDNCELVIKFAHNDGETGLLENPYYAYSRVFKNMVENLSGGCMELLLKVGNKITVLTGDEFSAVSLMSMGVKGAIMATANIVPDAWVKMYQLIQEGKIQESLDMSLNYYMLFKALFSENYVSPLKYAMVKAGIPGGSEDVLLPLIESKSETVAWVDAEMKRLNLI